MIFKVDDSQPADSIHHHWSETSYDGLPDSYVPEIPPHWHKLHDEHMEVVQGRVEFTADGKTVIAKAGDEVLTIPRMHTHSFKFFKGKATTLKEYTTPAGDFKESFFEDLLDEGSMTLSSALRAGYYGDTYFALPGGFKMLDQAVTLGLGGIAAYFFPQKNKGMLAESAKKAEVVPT